MILFLTGDNTFEIDRALKQECQGFAGDVESIDADNMTLSELSANLSAQTLFSSERFIILRDPANNKDIWSGLPGLLEKTDATTSIVVAQAGADKRTSTYKWLVKHADTKEFKQWSERDTFAAEQWAMSEAMQRGFELNKNLAHSLVVRTGNDQWRIANALDKLALASNIDEATMASLVESTPTENVFTLFESALSGKPETLHDKLTELALTEDAYKVIGLLSSQAFQLAVLHTAGVPSETVAKDLKAHPFVLSKLAPHAKRLNRDQIKTIVIAIMAADMRMKSTDANPWAVIESALLECNEASSK